MRVPGHRGPIRPRRVASRISGLWVVGALTLAVPFGLGAQSPADQAMATCPAEMDPALSGLVGVVRDSVRGVIIPGAMVQAAWSDDAGARETLSAETDGAGVYHLCGLPTDRSIVIQAAFASFATAPLSVTIVPGPPAGWDFGMAVQMGPVSNLLTTPGRIVGRIMDRQSGRPVEAASVSLVGEREDQDLSDGVGRYGFQDLDPGIYRVSVEHLAFETADQIIQVPADRTVEINFELTVDPIELEPLIVTAVREKHLEVRGFYERKELGERIGNGIFVTREEIDRVAPNRVTHFLSRFNGIRVDCSGSANNNCAIVMTGGSPSLSSRAEYGCVSSNVYVDGVRVIRDNQTVRESIDNFVSPFEIAGMEIYRGPGELPAEFGGSVGRCGAIVIWTRGAR